MIDNDFPIHLRPITEAEAASFPKHDEPKVPSQADEDEKLRRIKEEKDHRHPAFKAREAHRRRGEKVD